MDRQLLEEWVKSPEGRAELAKATEASNELLEALNEARRLDPALLGEPMTI